MVLSGKLVAQGAGKGKASPEKAVNAFTLGLARRLSGHNAVTAARSSEKM
jgi:hypothetical protein